MEWSRESIHELTERQRAFFRSGKTLPVSWRREQLKRLKKALLEHEQVFLEALAEDLGRSQAEAYFCDIGSVILEINETLRGLRRWARPELHLSGIVCFPSVFTKVYHMPYGVSLIISPFNFPVLLSLGVLTASIAAGNTAIIKVSSKSPACSAALRELVGSCFPREYVAVVEGGHNVADLCLAERVDKIFYTGSPRIGVHVMEAAARNLIPVSLELGGQTGNWCIVRKDADLRDAARKIAFFKLCNSGQICININQVAVASEAADEFIAELAAAFRRQIGENAVENPEYPRLISPDAYKKCAEEAELYRKRIVFGGIGDPDALKYAPTIIYPVTADEDIVRHELFNPLLPVVPFPDERVEDILDTIAGREHGLALYLFTKDLKWAERVMSCQQYGGGCVNEVRLHLMVKGVPFNGVGRSGMGAYHGKWGFMEFSHPSTVLYGSRHFNLPLREHPYSGGSNNLKFSLLKLFER